MTSAQLETERNDLYYETKTNLTLEEARASLATAQKQIHDHPGDSETSKRAEANLIAYIQSLKAQEAGASNAGILSPLGGSLLYCMTCTIGSDGLVYPMSAEELVASGKYFINGFGRAVAYLDDNSLHPITRGLALQLRSAVDVGLTSGGLVRSPPR